MNFDNVEAAFRVLGLEPGTPLEEVKSAYKFSLQAYHPDKFPPDSASQKMATEKLIAVKDANELICAFYLEHPDGTPPDGWRSTSSSKTSNDASQGSDSGDSTDWTQWNKQQSSGSASELHEWEKREEERRKNDRSGYGRDKRQKLVTYSKVGLVIILLTLWSGKMQNNAIEPHKRKMQSDAWLEKSRYFAQTGNGISGYRMTPDEAKAKAMDEADAMKAQWQQEDAQRWLGLLFLVALTGGSVYAFRSKKVKELLDQWIDGAATEGAAPKV